MKAKIKAKITPANMLIYNEVLIPQNNFDKKAAQLKGNFEKRILIVTDILIPKSEAHILLEKMLTATNLTEQDIYHLELNEKKPIQPLLHELSPVHTICFGPFLNSASINFDPYLYKTIQINDYQLLIVDNLSIISKDNSLKQALWNSLKKMFDL